MAGVNIQDLLFMDTEEEEDSSSSAPSQPSQPLKSSSGYDTGARTAKVNNTNLYQNIRVPQNSKNDTHDCSGKRASGSRVSMGTTTGRGSPITATLQIIPNIADSSDTESVVDNTQCSSSKVDNVMLNNLDKGSVKKKHSLDGDDKYLIPDLTDTTYGTAGMDGNMYLIPGETDKGGDEDDKYLIPNMPDLFLSEKRKPPPPRHQLDSSMDGLDGSSSAAEPTMSRHSSMSSLASEPGRRGSDGRTSRSRRRRRDSTKPRIKSNFADATLEYIRDRLRGRLFSGWLEEKQRLETVVRGPRGGADNIGGGDVVEMWRDVVEVDSCEEDMVLQLTAVMTSVPGVKDGKKWINITPPGAVQGFLLWVLLGDPRPPGHYWFKVVEVTTHPTLGLQLHLALVRSLATTDAETAAERKRRMAAAAATAAGDLPLTLKLAWESLRHSVSSSCSKQTISNWAAIVLHPSNIAYAIRMLVFAVVSIVMGTMHAAREVVRLFLMFMRESGTLIDRATPLVHILVTCVEKVIGGFFLLIAMVYRDVRRPTFTGGSGAPSPPSHYPQQQITYPGGNGRRGGPPSYGSARRYVSGDSWQ